jgi:hypothetical protein
VSECAGEENKTSEWGFKDAVGEWASKWVMRVEPTDECCDLVLNVPYDRLVDLNQNVREDLAIPAKRSTKRERVCEDSEESEVWARSENEDHEERASVKRVREERGVSEKWKWREWRESEVVAKGRGSEL